MVKKAESKKVSAKKVVVKLDGKPEEKRQNGLKVALEELNGSIAETKAKLKDEKRPEYKLELDQAYDVLLAQKERILGLIK